MLVKNLSAELAMRSVDVTRADGSRDTARLKKQPGWKVRFVPRAQGRCDLKATRADESFELTGLEWKKPVSVRQAAIRLAWVSELTPKEREALSPEELDVSAPQEEPEGEIWVDKGGASSLEPPELRWLPFATASVEIAGMNESLAALWGLEVGVFSKGRWAVLLRGFGTLSAVQSDIVYDDGLSSERSDLRAHGASVGGEFRHPVQDFGLLGQINLGFLSAKEQVPPIAPGVSDTRDLGATLEGLAGVDWSVKGFVVRLLGGYRFVGPLDNIGARRFSFSGPVARLSLGYRGGQR